MTDKTEAERLADELREEAEKRVCHVAMAPASLLKAAAAELRRLSAEVEALRADAGRLDFIEKHARCDPKMDGQHVWWPTNFNHALKGPTLRAAIDAAAKDKP